MRLTTTLMALFLTSQVFAGEILQRKFEVDFHGDHQGNKIYYRCESARKILENRLITLGAQSLETRCTGGLESYGRIPYWQPLTLSATFEIISGSEVRETVVVNADQETHEDCFLNVLIVDKALKLLPDARVVKKKNACLNNYTKWSYIVEVSK